MMLSSAAKAMQADARRWTADPVGQDKTLGAMQRPSHCLHIVFSAPVAPSRGAREIVQSPANTGGWDGAKHFHHRFCNG